MSLWSSGPRGLCHDRHVFSPRFTLLRYTLELRLIADLTLGVIHGASLSLQVIILLETCCESILRKVSAKAKLISFTFRYKNKECQLMFDKSLRIELVLAVL